MQTLFPEIRPYREMVLERGVHRLHVEEAGNPAGIPILLLHDGPGGGIDPIQARLLNAERFRIIQFDQRGSGRSQPQAETSENTLDDLVADIEAIRLQRGIGQWLVHGHGWGATLALAYAQRFAQCLAGVVLSGLFLGRRQDIDWAFGEGVARFFPEAWREFAAHDPGATTEALLRHYAERLATANELQQVQAARQWARWTSTVQGIHASQDLAERLQHPHIAISLARLGCHYYVNHCFLDQCPLLERLQGLDNVRAILVHGRFDVVSPIRASFEVQRRWPGSQLYIVREGSHSLRDAPMSDAVMRALSVMGEHVAGDEGPVAE